MSASPELILIMVGMMLNFPAWKKKGHKVTPERTTHKTNSRVRYYTGETAAAPEHVLFPGTTTGDLQGAVLEAEGLCVSELTVPGCISELAPSLG